MRIVSIGGGNKAPILEDTVARYNVGNVLVVPSACSTPKSYDKKVPATEKLFAEQLRVPKVSILHGFNQQPSPTQIEHEVGTSELIYVIGGNTPFLMKTLALHGSMNAIKQATLRNHTVLTGTSAGALLPFQKAMINPAARPAEQTWNFEFIDGLDVIAAAATAHANQHDPCPENAQRAESRAEWFFQNLGEVALPGLAIDNHAALVIDGLNAAVSRSDPSAQVYLSYNFDGDKAERVTVDNDSLTAFWQSLTASPQH